MLTTAPLANHVEDFELLDVPFLFRDYGHVDRVLDGSIGARLLRRLPSHGMHGFVFLDGGFRLFSTNRAVRTLAEFRGLRVRVLQNRIHVNLIKAFGGVPVPAPRDRIVEMARKGYINAADRSLPTYWDIGLYAVQRFVLDTRHLYVAKVLVANETFYKQLSASDRAALEAGARACRDVQRRQFRAELQRVQREARQRGVQIFTLSKAEKARFEAAARPVVEQATRLVGEAAVRQVRETR
jgi:TRAP-type C4-dicarboxylate transport system substrate-binding protein